MSDLVASQAAFQPRPSTLTAPFWDAAGQGRLALSRCPQCRQWQHPPLECCRYCATPLAPEAAPMHGLIYSSTLTYHPAVPLYDPPYAVAVVEVGGSGGPRVVLRVVDSDYAAAVPGAAVRIEVRDLPGGDFTVPVAIVSCVGKECE